MTAGRLSRPSHRKRFSVTGTRAPSNIVERTIGVLWNRDKPMKAQHREYYDLLGVLSDASQDEIKKAFRAKAKECHPDHHPGDAEKESTFKRLSIVYGVLSNPDSRRHYDETGDGPQIDNILTEVYGLIIQTFQTLKKAAGDDILYGDPFKRMKDVFTESKDDAEGHIKKLKSQNDRNDKLIKKITHKAGGKDSFLHLALAEEKRENGRQMERAKHAIEIMDRACAVLDEFTFKAEKRIDNVTDRRSRVFSFGFGSHTFDVDSMFGTKS